MAKPKIAVVPLWDDEKESIWMVPGYMDGIRDAGGIPIILSLSSSTEDVLEIFEMCDGLLMTGGHDVSPALYHQEKTESCGQACI
ncbi:MAG: gamma-glutamyl-gamma-aminobutyrate hydrolase family protein [Lachnospiraceae bacterium]|nr:gamma-glutamyl-gamma-aminobutyrate hydrolase family protein [Lachnospiraceae bacterium]